MFTPSASAPYSEPNIYAMPLDFLFFGRGVVGTFLYLVIRWIAGFWILKYILEFRRLLLLFDGSTGVSFFKPK